MLLVTGNTVAAKLLGFFWGLENEAKVSLLKKKIKTGLYALATW